MPCDSSYMGASSGERYLSQVYQLLDELEGKQINKNDWNGYDERAYSKFSREHLDKKVMELCSKLQGINVKDYSLEMQLWWREHSNADRERLRKEL